ncbi:porphobilinogen deaminase, dipyromethane cofactor binding domain-containing protein [Suillus subalutaceus]|uniref:porphobilinogen deaminase, dipyromethane cofactor binding domain-containing protein n=1 Tax=Suillus subalutaceus TaxID=48586 RepID=UPI001B8653F1|nr:porphobilinogen deaminase, dipyromethane cofactor binding domain-containing protein [Suillus subalutaceus]KAG1845725.1 porphobilinogen deaminase, dipyromethane cofactor binding domain-containing protein [Suillus subalutaceus]
MASNSRSFVLASRASKLAQIQTNFVRDGLEAAFPALSFGTSFMSTEGDKNQSQALYLLGGKALWTKELEVALKENVVDMLVHCLKDMPTTLPHGCELGAILERENPVDSLVVKQGLPYKTLEDLPEGSVVGTSSVRRVAQLRRSFPGLVFLDVRGNLNTRLAKLDAPDGPYTALILAKAGLVRLGMGDRITTDLTAPILFHAVSQGALGVEIRADDQEARELCKMLTHQETQWKCLAERALLRELEGGCSVPVGVSTSLSQIDKSAGELTRATLTITGSVTSLDGSLHVQDTLSQEVESIQGAEELGRNLAIKLKSNGAKAILDDITQDRRKRASEAETAE